MLLKFGRSTRRGNNDNGSKGWRQVPLATSLGALVIEGGPCPHFEPTERGLIYALLDMLGRGRGFGKAILVHGDPKPNTSVSIQSSKRWCSPSRSAPTPICMPPTQALNRQRGLRFVSLT